MKSGVIYLIAGVLVVLAVVAIGAVFLINSNSPQATQNTNTPRARNTPGAGTTNANAASQDPLDDSGGEVLPNVPINSTDDSLGQDPLDDSAPNTNNPNIPTAAPPPADGGMVSLPDTAWVQMESDELYEFCADNRWLISDEGDTVTGTGTFEQTSSTLILSGDGDPKTYEVTWDSAATVLTLKQGETTLNLAYDGASDCP